jgi:hypothetical protein
MLGHYLCESQAYCPLCGGGLTLHHRNDISVLTVATEDKTTVFVTINYKFILKRPKYIYLHYEERAEKSYNIYKKVSYKEACLSAYILRDIITGLNKLPIADRM